LGTLGFDAARAVATDRSGNVYTAGGTTGSIGASNTGGFDGFVAKYDSQGNQLFTKQLGTQVMKRYLASVPTIKVTSTCRDLPIALCSVRCKQNSMMPLSPSMTAMAISGGSTGWAKYPVSDL
jgi:hypothetical protein